MEEKVKATEGMLYHIIRRIRPRLAERVAESGRLDTIILGLGGQGSKHAGLMRDFGTSIVAGVAPGASGTRVHEVIPVYDSVRECLADHPDIVAASIWRHYSTAKEAAVEAIEAGIPLVVLITEGIPLRDVRDIIVAARTHRTVLIGGNTPGLIFPPERIKIGMLPDVFYPEEVSPGRFGAGGVTIISRSGAILYHMSDAMASAGIAQNAVIGVGGDGAIGSSFRDLVPMAMEFEKTDLVIVAGEIGGCQEELLAQDVQAHQAKYPKPLVALISGAHAPEGKTMGHAGAIITPGVETGTFQSKKKALESAGVPVVNSQYDLIDVVRTKLKGKTYFEPARYYAKMKSIWEAPPPKSSWTTLITKVEPNNLVVRGYRVQDLIERASLVQTAHLIIQGELPDAAQAEALERLAMDAALKPFPAVVRNPAEDLSKTIQKCLLNDEVLTGFKPQGKLAQAEKTVFALGRFTAYLAGLQDHGPALRASAAQGSLGHAVYRAILGRTSLDAGRARMIEAIIVASLDHGVTPPSVQATLIASSVRASYEVAVAQGVGAITDVHGGAGEKAAVFFRSAAALSRDKGLSPEEALRAVIREYVHQGKRIEGMGHRVHTQDPRRDVLWRLAEQAGVAGDCVAISKLAEKALREVRGLSLPINVDGVIGAIVADMGLDPKLAKALFVFGRIMGLSAHYFEEITSQPPMRTIDFAQAVYRGTPERSYPA
ncbi:MAG TPA: citrate/2-methylcitrate synthase [Burkholderiales bacterium]|nr:citrate/2-methylcitrate synthase [Burkholderiales bacterium]